MDKEGPLAVAVQDPKGVLFNRFAPLEIEQPCPFSSLGVKAMELRGLYTPQRELLLSLLSSVRSEVR